MSILDTPDFVTQSAADEWNRIIEEFAARGLLTELKRGAIEAYCVHYGRWRDAEQKVTELGPYVRDTKTGRSRVNPYLAIADQAARTMRRLMRDLRMVDGEPTPGDPEGKPTPATGKNLNSFFTNPRHKRH